MISLAIILIFIGKYYLRETYYVFNYNYPHFSKIMRFIIEHNNEIRKK